MRAPEPNEPARTAHLGYAATADCRNTRLTHSNGLAPKRRAPSTAQPSKHSSPSFASEWVVWQIADSAFPTGGFAHSGGLEAAWQQGEIGSLHDLSEFIRAQLSQAGRASLPFVNEAFRGERPFSELDHLCDAFLCNHVANRASRAQGQAFLLATESAFASGRVRALRAGIRCRQLPAHFAPVFGAVARVLKLGHQQCVRLFLFLVLRTLISSGVRLGAVGPLAAQALQADLAAEAERISSACAGLRVADVAQTSPLLDLWHAAHDRLYSRLFQT